VRASDTLTAAAAAPGPQQGLDADFEEEGILQAEHGAARDWDQRRDWDTASR